MSETKRIEAEKLAKRLNGFFHALFGAWLGMTAVFWLQAWGPMRSYAEDQAQVSVPLWFAASVAAGMSSILLPSSYYAIKNPASAARRFERFGIRRLRYWITDGDLVRLRVRRIDPSFVEDGHRRALEDRLLLTRNNERAHLGFLAFGVVSAVAAGITGWWSWAIAITLGNVAVNLLPVFLQRYTRARIARLMARRTSTATT